MPGLSFTGIGDDAAHLSDHGIEKTYSLVNRGFFIGGDFVKDGRFQNFRGMIVIFGGVDHGARTAGGDLPAQSFRQDAMNAAGPGPCIETDAGHGGGDLFRLGDRLHQASQIRRRGGILYLHRTDARHLHAIMMGNVYGIAPGVSAQGFHSIRGHFSHHQPGESSGAKGFIEKKTRLNGAETKSYECALSGK
jgi:hypothetical protein